MPTPNQLQPKEIMGSVLVIILSISERLHIWSLEPTPWFRTYKETEAEPCVRHTCLSTLWVWKPSVDNPVHPQRCLVDWYHATSRGRFPFRSSSLVVVPFRFLLCCFVQAKVITYFDIYKFYSLKMISLWSVLCDNEWSVEPTPWSMQNEYPSLEITMKAKAYLGRVLKDLNYEQKSHSNVSYYKIVPLRSAWGLVSKNVRDTLPFFRIPNVPQSLCTSAFETYDVRVLGIFWKIL